MNWLAQWFAVYWQNRGNAQSVVDGYLALGQKHKLTLADIALRGKVFVIADPSNMTPFAAGVAEGRRQLALEIFKLANERPEIIYPLLERRDDKTDKRT